MRKRITYANVVATLALVFAMSGGALAAKHYLINSTGQISPKVLKSLRGRTGARGKTGATGAAGTAGAPGKEGPRGLEGKAVTRFLGAFSATGAVTRAQGLQTIEHPATGVYKIVWSEDVSQCYPVANIFATGGYVVMDGIVGNTLSVDTFNTANAATDEAFYVAVIC